MGRTTGLVIAVAVWGSILAMIAAVIGMLFGAAAGWLGALIFPQVFDRLTAALFGEAIPAWQFGAMLGFISGIVRASVVRHD